MPKKNVDYSKTVMYKFVCNDLNITDNYAGHTTNFTKRKGQHKDYCTNPNAKGFSRRLYQTIRENGGWDNWTMIEIEKYPCNDNNEAGARERYWFEQLNSTMNIKTPNRSVQQYRVDNADVINMKKKEVKICGCGKSYTERHASRHRISQYHCNWEKLKLNILK